MEKQIQYSLTVLRDFKVLFFAFLLSINDDLIRISPFNEYSQ